MTRYNAFEALQKDLQTFPPLVSQDAQSEISPTQLYKSSLLSHTLPAHLNILPKQFTSDRERMSILDTLRAAESGIDVDGDIDDLGLPSIKENTEMTLYQDQDPTTTLKSGTRTNALNLTHDPDAFANPQIVAKYGNQVKKSEASPARAHHSQWKLSKLLLGHAGQVSAVCMDPFNSFFVTGSSDSTMKFWDLATGELQLTLSGHIMAVRDMKISSRHPYLFSCSEDKTVKCWDLEKNVVIRDYHGHLSSVYTLDIHPELDIIVTGGRDSSVRVWDIRSRTPIHVMSGHRGSVNQVSCQGLDPQIVSCSMDSTVKTWDLVAGKCRKTLTFHSKSVRAFSLDSERQELVTSSSDGLKKFALPDCEYLQELQFWDGHNVVEEGNLIVNTVAQSNEGVLFAGCDNGKFAFWDWDSGVMFQNDIQTPVSGSLASESGILCSTFDHTGDRLITGNIDKSVRVWKKVDNE
jgi:pleiotropic regulator 1